MYVLYFILKLELTGIRSLITNRVAKAICFKPNLNAIQVELHQTISMDAFKMNKKYKHQIINHSYTAIISICSFNTYMFKQFYFYY